jgi:benzoylformate decarboxylase
MTTNISAKNACSLIVDQLLAEGVGHVFMAPRSASSPLAMSLGTAIHRVEAPTEAAASFMALGHAQASSRAAVVILSAGQGLVSALPAMYTASRIHLPLVVICDQQSSQTLNDDPPLYSDLLSISRPVCKWVAETRGAAEIPRILRRAFTEAFSPPKGPVLISIPIDIYGQSAHAANISPPHTSPLGAADHSFVLKTARSLVSAKSPCIITGNEVSQYRARKETATLAEVVGCPVYSEPMPTGVNFPNRHPQFAGVLSTNIDDARTALKKHDLILALGMQTRLPAQRGEEALLPGTAAVIQINVDPTLAGKTLPCIAASTADIAESMSRVRAEIQLIADNNWLNMARSRAHMTIQEVSTLRQKLEENLSYPSENDPISLFWLLRSIDGARTTNSIIVTDIVGTRSDPSLVMSLEGSSAYFASNSGTDGYALGAAIGTQMATPDTPVICITSDQSLLHDPAALWCAARYGLNTKIIIVNTHGKKTLNLHLGTVDSPYPLGEPEIEFTDIARAMHVPGQKVVNMGQLENYLFNMFDAKGPYLLDVTVEES